MPTFTQDELKRAVSVAKSSGRPSPRTRRRPRECAARSLAGVATIEHGDNGTPEVFQLMAENGICLCPTVAAGDAILSYRGWRRGVDPDPASITEKKASFKAALDAGVTICNGSDVGVFTHGDNAREVELMVNYGLTPLQALRAATSTTRRCCTGRTGSARVKAGCSPI